MSDGVSSTVVKALDALQLLAAHPGGLSVTQLCSLLNTQRAPLYRILRALEAHRLVRRDAGRAYRLSIGLVPLATAASGELDAVVHPVLARLADATGCSASLVFALGDDVVTAAAVLPGAPGMHIATPAGFVHPRQRLASHVAIEAGRPARADDAADVRLARQRGWAESGARDDGVRYGLAAPLDLAALGEEGCLLLLTQDRADPEGLATPLAAAAAELSRVFGAPRARD